MRLYYFFLEFLIDILLENQKICSQESLLNAKKTYWINHSFKHNINTKDMILKSPDFDDKLTLVSVPTTAAAVTSIPAVSENKRFLRKDSIDHYCLLIDAKENWESVAHEKSSKNSVDDNDDEILDHS